MTTYYVPENVTQLDGSPCRSSNCWAAADATLLDGATGGGATLTPTAFRARAGGGSGSADKDNPDCRSGFEVDVEKGLDRMGVKATIIRVPRPRAAFILGTQRSAMFAVATDYELWPKDLKAAAPTFKGNHMVTVIPGQNADNEVRVGNPLAAGYQRINLADLLDAAEKFAREHGRGPVIHLVRIYRPADMGAAASDLERRVAALERENESLRDALDDAHDRSVADTIALAPYNKPEDPR